MAREDTTVPNPPMLGMERRYYRYPDNWKKAKANLEAAGYYVMYEHYPSARYTPHKLTFWLPSETKEALTATNASDSIETTIISKGVRNGDKEK